MVCYDGVADMIRSYQAITMVTICELASSTVETASLPELPLVLRDLMRERETSIRLMEVLYRPKMAGVMRRSTIASKTWSSGKSWTYH